ncbi:hypothetical protein [Helicobacter cetorum]|uniref:hypothetical protein n=1 Tax=Helicobacter cetorum TaxID=138563 RepID=UPI002D79BAF6|nr:hypothetical protein [Helicobacter cetorum]
MVRFLVFLVMSCWLWADATISTTIDPNVMFYDNSTGNVKKDRKRVLKNMVNLEKERVKGFNKYSETKMSKGDLSAFGAFFKDSLESCVKQGICYYENKNGKVSFVVNDREKFYKHILQDLGTELSLPLFNWLYKGSDFGALHEQFGDMYDGYIKYLVSMVRISQKEKEKKINASVLKREEEQARKQTEEAIAKRKGIKSGATTTRTPPTSSSTKDSTSKVATPQQKVEKPHKKHEEERTQRK